MPLFLTTSHQDTDLIEKIADRIMRNPADFPYTDKMFAMIDLIVVHANGTPLDLDALLSSSDQDFHADITAIAKTLDHDTGKLPPEYRPRFVRQ